MRYRIELLPNGLYSLFDYKCKWSGVYNSDGSFRGGNTFKIKHLNEIASFDSVTREWVLN
jgi:hypothetical protein